MDAERGDQFIGMYVNELTRDYGDEGREATRELLARAEALGAYAAPVRVQFVE
jgi:1,4-dihydroxy-6-naphthoate synthase